MKILVEKKKRRKREIENTTGRAQYVRWDLLMAYLDGAVHGIYEADQIAERRKEAVKEVVRGGDGYATFTSNSGEQGWANHNGQSPKTIDSRINAL